MIDAGVDIYAVKEFLGHSSVAMTEKITYQNKKIYMIISKLKKQSVLSILKELELLDDPLNNPISKVEMCRRVGVSKTFYIYIKMNF